MGSKWRGGTIKNILPGPRIAGYVVYQGEILYGPDGNRVRGQWEPILTEEEYEAVMAKWRPIGRGQSRLGQGTRYRTTYLLSPFVRCGKCNARMHGSRNDKTADHTRILPVPGQRARRVRRRIAARRAGQKRISRHW